MRSLDPRSLTPPYRQIADAIVDAIRAGDFVAGDPIPPRAWLAVHFGVASATVTRAVGILKQEGVLESRQGGRVSVRAAVEVLPDTEVSALERIEDRLERIEDRLRGLSCLIYDAPTTGE